MMNEHFLIEATERYLKGEMNSEERSRFEQDRKINPELDQYVVGHDLFQKNLEHYSNLRRFKQQLHETHHHLVESGRLQPLNLGKVVKMQLFWKKYKKTISIAATIAGVIAISINAITYIISPNGQSKKVQELVNTVNAIKIKQSEQDNKLKSLTSPKLPSNQVITGSGTAFLIDGKGILATNAHVLRNAKGAVLTNNKGMEFRAKIIYTDLSRDIALLKIEDEDYLPKGYIPYSIRKTTGDLAEPIFTIGYPDDKFVYGEGYLSSFTGFQGDTLSCQIAIAANPGNSGGPVFNRNGEIIGILSKRELQSEGVVYAIRAKYITDAVAELQKQDQSITISKLPSVSSLRGLDKTVQVKRIQDYVYMVKAF